MRWLPSRGGRWPAHLDRRTRQGMGIPPAERVLGWGMARGADGERHPVVATDCALYGSGLAARVPWEAFSKATWDDPILGLVVTSAGASGAGATTAEHLELVEPGLLPAAVRTQVTGSVVITVRLDLGQGAGAQAIARRSSSDGSVRWTIAFDPGMDPSDPQLRARAEEALAELRTTLGI